jgi:hypothetical protein
MKRLALLFSVFLGLVFGLQGQTSSSRSNTLKLNFSASVPQVTWLSPIQFASTSAEKSMMIKIGVTSESKVSKIELFVNDLPADESRGFAVVESADKGIFDEIFQKEARFRIGDNNLKVVVENDDGGTATSTRLVNYSAPVVALAAGIGVAGSGRQDYALVFGTDEYVDWGDLTNPVNDANTIAAELKESYGFKVEVIENATKRVVLTKIREYSKKSYLEDDQLLIFFAGHGQFDEVTKTGYIVTSDSEKGDEIKETYLSHSVLRDQINNIPCKHVLLTMDACFGGTFDPVIAKAGSRGEDDYELTKPEFVKRKLRFKTRLYLTSGGKEYVPDGRPGSHSPFARKILEALRNYGGKDGVVTMNELNTYLERLETLPRSGEFGDNEPGSDFVFVAR